MNENIKFVKDPKAKIAEAIARNKDEYNLYIEVRNVLVTLQGKNINKRIETAVAKVLVDCDVKFQIKHCWYELVVGKAVGNLYREVKVMLGYTSEGDVLKLQTVEARNTPYTVGSVNVIKNLEAVLPDVQNLISQVLEAQEALTLARTRLGDATYYVSEH